MLFLYFSFGFCPVFSTECKVIIKVIDINNEVPIFEKNDVSQKTDMFFVVYCILR